MKPKTLFLGTFCIIACLAAWCFTGATKQPSRETSRPLASGASPVEAAKPVGDSAEMPLRTKHKERPADASRTGKLDDDFTPANYQRRPMGEGTGSASGAAIAYVQIPSTNRRVALPPNSLGEYEAQTTLTEETVGVRLRIEDVTPGTPVSVVILDGGAFPDGSGPSKIIKLGQDSSISFRFTTSANIGHHRIRVLPAGGAARLFDFTAEES